MAERIRHRALVEVLLGEELSWESYRETYRKLVRRDREALFSQAILSPEDFIRLFADWQAADTERYGVGDESLGPLKRRPPESS